MITIPLSDVVAFLTRRGVDLACLEGAPMILPGGERCVYAPHAMLVGDIIGLYLGRNTVCPAAMGWVCALLAGGRYLVGAGVCVDDRSVLLYDRFADRMLWQWGGATPSDGRVDCSMPYPMPLNHAERLRAVLLHEMGRV